MKKRLLLILLFLLIVPSVLAYTSEERALIRECRADCVDTKNLERSEINLEYKSCRAQCEIDSDICLENLESSYDSCKLECTDRKCESQCYKEFREEKRSCRPSICRSECSQTKRFDSKDVSSEYRECRNNCKYTALNDNIVCNGGKYQAGEEYIEGCYQCVCGYDGESDCVEHPTCNLKPFEDQESCESYGGLYQKLCQGPYFRLRCSREEYCICSGDRNYQCPSGNQCLKEFNIKTSSTNQDGYRDLKGLKLGDIGICAS